MRTNFLFSLCFFILLSACKDKQETNKTNAIEQNDNQGISEKTIENLDYIDYALDGKAENVIQDWTEYFQIEDVINNIKTGDLSFFDDNEKAIKLLLKEVKANIPEEAKTNSIEARLLVVETKLSKLESLSNLSSTSTEELLKTIEEFLIAFSNLNLQINKKVEFDRRIIEKP